MDQEKNLLSIWAATLSIVCLVTGVFCGLRRVLLWDRQGPQTPCLWPILSSLCSNTTPQMWPRWSDRTVVVHCWEVFKSQTLYDEFWINLSFGRPLRSGALLEWWTDCDCSFILLRHVTVMWVNGCVAHLHRLPVSFHFPLTPVWYFLCAWLT